MNLFIALNGLNDLSSHVSLIEAYMTRYKIIMTTASAEKSYMKTLEKGKNEFNELLNRISARNIMINNYARETRLLLFENDLIYDSEEIIIADKYEANYTTKFIHAVLIVSYIILSFPIKYFHFLLRVIMIR